MKKYTKSDLTYLNAIEKCTKDFWYCRAVDISRTMNITPWSTCTGLKKMLKHELIEFDSNKFVKITAQAKKDLIRFNKNKIILQEFFDEFVFDESLTRKNINRIIHLLDQEFVNYIEKENKSF